MLRILALLTVFVVQLAGLVTPVRAQLRLPAPATATPNLLGTAGLSPQPAISGRLAGASLETAAGLRTRMIETLVREHRREIDVDFAGEPVVRGTLLALSPTDAALDQARSMGFTIDRESRAVAELRFAVLRVAGIPTSRALQRLRSADPAGLYEFDHLYLDAGFIDKPPAAPTQDSTAPAAGATAVTANPPRPPIRVGLLDTGLDATHPVFGNSTLHRWGCEGNVVAAEHGTAVGSLIIGHDNAELFAADVYCGKPTGGALDTIIAALGWLESERVAVINISLVGPRNAIFEQVTESLSKRGFCIVAAVGNDGPTAPPLYPAAYPSVVGVTGVDAKRRVLIEAERGPQVMFAARGTDLQAGNMSHAYSDVRGTSFAAPIIAALLARQLTKPDPRGAFLSLEQLSLRAIDLGVPGRDLTYGFGLLEID